MTSKTKVTWSSIRTLIRQNAPILLIFALAIYVPSAIPSNPHKEELVSLGLWLLPNFIGICLAQADWKRCQSFNWGGKLFFIFFYIVFIPRVISLLHYIIVVLNSGGPGQSLASKLNGELQLQVAVLALFVGWLFFQFRFHYRALYGISEVVAGASFAYYRVQISTDSDPTFGMSIVTAGIYLVVRGLDNFHAYLKGDGKDPIYNFFVGDIAKLNDRLGETLNIGTKRQAP